MVKIGIQGGSFDPIHLGHLIIAEEAYHSLGLSKVLFVPANIQPHKRELHCAEAKDRYAMVKAAVRGRPYFEASDIELRRKGISYTVDTLKELRKLYGSRRRFYFIIGADTIPELPTWRDIRQVARLCTFAVAMRPGASLERMDQLAGVIGREAVAKMHRNILQTPLMGISSTDIRARVREGRTIAHMVPTAVESYIKRHGLYRG